jgi:hypothetical protein
MAVYRWAAHRRLREVPFGGGTWTTRPHLNPIMLLRDQCTAVAVYVMKTHLPEQARQHPLFSVQCHGAKGFRSPSSGCCEPDLAAVRAATQRRLDPPNHLRALASHRFG